MSNVSAVIAPLGQLHRGPGLAAVKKFTFDDNTTVIYPKLPGGATCRVVIIRRSVTSSHGSVFHVCRNAGKWSYRIDYAFQGKTSRMPRGKFIAELTRMGGGEFLGDLMAGVS